MNTVNISDCLFILIDFQEKLVKMIGNENITSNAIKLAQTSSILKIPVIISEQYPQGLGQTIGDIKQTAVDAYYIEKTNFSLLKELNFKEKLREYNKNQIVISGIETHICVLQTAFDLLNEGYKVFVVQDACGSRTLFNKNAALERMISARIQVITTEMLIFELLQNSKHPNFKQIQNLIK